MFEEHQVENARATSPIPLGTKEQLTRIKNEERKYRYPGGRPRVAFVGKGEGAGDNSLGGDSVWS